MWAVKIHPLVVSDDFKSISSEQQKLIIKAIEKKLAVDPHGYGEPLRGGFSGYWRLRVGDYRVVYRIVKDQIVVLVIKVGIRRDDTIYKELFSKLKRI